jgi:hypothetical protein
MTTRQELTEAVSSYLTDHFPNADITVKTDGLTANAVFTITEGGVARHVEVTKRWLDGDDAGVSLPDAIRQWGLAKAIRGLEANGVLRVGMEGFEKVS